MKNSFSKGDLIEKKKAGFNKLLSGLISNEEGQKLTSVSDWDKEHNLNGYVVCQEENEKDHWFVSDEYMQVNYKVAKKG